MRTYFADCITRLLSFYMDQKILYTQSLLLGVHALKGSSDYQKEQKI